MQLSSQHIKTVSLLAPLVVFFAVAWFMPDKATGENAGDIDPSEHLWQVIVRCVLMLVILAAFWRSYIAEFKLQIDHWGVIVGVVGAALWVGICALQIEHIAAKVTGLQHLLPERSGVNPWECYPDASTRWLFLGFRFTLLVAAVPLAEELFLRGYFMRAMDAVDWQSLPLREIGTTGLVAGTVYGVLSHPSECVAAAVWFSLVTWMMLRTGKFWNCVLAHAVTNLILGVYVCTTGTWDLW